MSSFTVRFRTLLCSINFFLGCSSAVQTARSLLELEAAKRELEAEGVPVLITMQISRSVTDADIPNCHEIVIK